MFELMDGSPLMFDSFHFRKFSPHLYKGKLNFFCCQCQVSTTLLSESIIWAKKGNFSYWIIHGILAVALLSLYITLFSNLY